MTWLKAQLHLHVKGDKIDNVKPSAKEFIHEAARLNYDILCITCHDKMIFRKEDQRFAEKNNIVLLPGIEKTIEKAHVLIINAHPESEFIETFEDLKIYKKDHKESIIIAPHPYFKMGNCLGKNLKKHAELFDAIELCHFKSKLVDFNKKAIKFANKKNLPLIATADAHYLEALKYGYTFLHPKSYSLEGILEAIRSGFNHNYLQEFSTLELIKLYRKLQKSIK